MGLFAQAGTAMPLPPAQAEAIYDLSLDDERFDGGSVGATLSHESTDEVSAAIRQSALVMVTGSREPTIGQELQTVLGENPELPPSDDRTKP